MLASLLALAMMQSTCSMTIGIGKDGTIFTDRFNGWYKTSSKTLESLLHGGCYNDNNPSPVTSVKVILAPDTPKQNADLVFVILKKAGWPREKLDLKPWSQYPHKPDASLL